jgi:hypothetical protein
MACLTNQSYELPQRGFPQIYQHHVETKCLISVYPAFINSRNAGGLVDKVFWEKN